MCLERTVTTLKSTALPGKPEHMMVMNGPMRASLSFNENRLKLAVFLLRQLNDMTRVKRQERMGTGLL